MSEQIATQEQKEVKISFNTISKGELEQRVSEQKEAQGKVEQRAEPEPAPINKEELTNKDNDTEKPKLPEQPQFSFHNEESEKFFNYFKDGKEEELRNFLNEKHKLSSLDAEKNEDIIKLNLQYSNSSYTKEEINDLFEEKYLRPDKPDEVEQGIDESDADFSLRQQKYEKQLEKFNKANEKIDKQIARDARLAKDELAKRNNEIVLPDIQKEQPKTNEPTPEELEGMKKFAEAFQKSVNEDVPNFKGYEAEYESEGAKQSVKYEITPEETKAIQNRFQDPNLDLEQELFKRWFDKDGRFKAREAAEDFYLLENHKKIFAKMASEGANSALKNHIKNQKNIDFEGGNVAVPNAKTAEEQQREMARHFFRN